MLLKDRDIRNILITIISASLIGFGSFFLTSYTTIQNVKENDARQNISIEKKADIKTVEDLKFQCDKNIDAVEKRCDAKIIESNNVTQQKLDLIIQLQKSK